MSSFLYESIAHPATSAEADETSRAYFVNNGTRDIGSAPTQILLLRGLDTLTTEEDIVSGLGMLTGRIGEEIQGGAIKRILLVRDRATRSSWGYAFVHLVDVRVSLQRPSTVSMLI